MRTDEKEYALRAQPPDTSSLAAVREGGLLPRAELLPGHERGRGDRLPAQVRPRGGDDPPGGQAQGVGQLQVVVAGEGCQVAGVDAQLGPGAQRLARRGEDARGGGQLVEEALGRRGRLGVAARATRPASVASRRASPERGSSGSPRGSGADPAVCRCSRTTARRAAATPARSRRR